APMSPNAARILRFCIHLPFVVRKKHASSGARLEFTVIRQKTRQSEAKTPQMRPPRENAASMPTDSGGPAEASTGPKPSNGADLCIPSAKRTEGTALLDDGAGAPSWGATRGNVH